MWLSAIANPAKPARPLSPALPPAALFQALHEFNFRSFIKRTKSNETDCVGFCVLFDDPVSDAMIRSIGGAALDFVDCVRAY